MTTHHGEAEATRLGYVDYASSGNGGRTTYSKRTPGGYLYLDVWPAGGDKLECELSSSVGLFLIRGGAMQFPHPRFEKFEQMLAGIVAAATKALP